MDDELETVRVGIEVLFDVVEEGSGLAKVFLGAVTDRIESAALKVGKREDAHGAGEGLPRAA